jgi:ATP-dependent DNA helicase Q4
VYRFSIAAAARAMGADLEEVQNQLQALSANGEGAYRLTDRAVGYEILKTPPRDVRPLAKALAAHLTNVEQCAVSKLDTVYAALELAANCETDETQSAILRVTLQA